MWLVVSFDISMENPEQKRKYRNVRKLLTEYGFLFIQKSICWKWMASHEQIDTLAAKLKKAISGENKLIMFRIRNQDFEKTLWIDHDTVLDPPNIPSPWNIFV